MAISTSLRFPRSLISIGAIFTLLFIFLSIPKKWEDATKVDEDGSISLSDQWAGAVGRKQDQYADHELYVLTAARDGYFLCEHCPSGKFFLKEMEVYRYGTTGAGQNGRGYSESWLARHALNYNIIIAADLATVRIEEAALIGNYAILPENLNRPLSSAVKSRSYWYRLVLPPGNKSLD